jgi:hypothetical protein
MFLNAKLNLLIVDWLPTIFGQDGPSFSKLLPSHKLVELNRDLSLSCEVQSNPQAVIIWKINGTYLYAYPNLTISSMQPENYGTYTCEASLKHFPTITDSIKIVPAGLRFFIPELDLNEAEKFFFFQDHLS